MVSFEYPTVGDYTIRVVALSGGLETTEATVNVTITTPTELPIDFEIFDSTVLVDLQFCSLKHGHHIIYVWINKKI